MTFRPLNRKGDLYFVTARVYGGKRIFSLPLYVKIVLKSWRWLRQNKRIKLCVFVVMPNHIHFIMKPQGKWTASRICYDFEKHTAHEILHQLRSEKQTDLTNFFKESAADYPDREHKIWRDIQAKNIVTEEFLIEKTEYIHNNPINKGWQLVKDRADYKCTYTNFYDRGEKAIIEIDDVRKMMI